MSPLAIPRGRLAPPETAFEAVLPHAVQVLLRSAVLAKLVTVCAPPGYGKTLVLGRLYRTLLQRGLRCVWLTLDDRDTNVDAVLSLLATALQQEIGLRVSSSGEFDSLPIDPRESADRLLTILGGMDSTTVLFVDNLHVCTDPQLASVLERLVFGSGPALRLALSSTQELPLDVSRAKLELFTVELEAQHLSLDKESLRGLLLQAGHTEPEPSLVVRMHELTEGWPAASRLLQVLISQHSSPEEVVAKFSGADHDMAAVLTRRVLSGFPARQVEFLMQVALLREFCEELAADATGCPEAGEWLDGMLRRNMLIFPLDRDRRWLRMHTLLRQYLLAEGSRRLTRELRQKVLERAARWHADHGDGQGALEAALAAPAPTLAGQLLDRVARSIAGDQGQLALFVKWAEQVLAMGVALSPEAHAWYAWSLCFSLQYERAFSALQSLDHRLAEIDPGGQRAAALRARLGLLRVVIAIHLDMVDTASEDAQRWLLDAVDRDPLGVATVATGAAIAELARGKPGIARQYLHTAEGAIGRSDSAYGSGWVALISAAIDLTEGDPVKADRRLAQIRPLVVDQLGEDAAVAASMDFVHARALHELGHLPEARAKAFKGLMTASTHGINETAQHGLAACVALWDGSEEGDFAPASLDRVVRCYAPRTQRQVAVHQLRRLLQLGRTDDAKEFAYRHMLTPDIDNAVEGTVGPEALLGLEWAWMVGQKRGLAERVEAFKKQANAEQRWRELLQVHLLEIDIHSQGGDNRRAQRSLAQALFVAARRRLVQPMFDRLPQLQPVLTNVSNRELGLVQPDEIDLLMRLKELLGDSHSAEPSSSEIGLAEPLTRRERELLELLEKGLSNQQIADRVNLSVPTVKWHFYKLFAKLQVKNRAAALVRARSLSLLR